MSAPDPTFDDAALAARHRPLLLLDAHEPYAPLFLGYSVFRSLGQSPSSSFAITPLGEACIEYAVWYDWDIGHLYDLEHVWVHVDAAGAVVAVEASRHGRREPMFLGTGLPELRDGRPVLYPEAGKHAHWAHPEQMDPAARQRLAALCGPLAGMEGVHLGNPFARAGAYAASPADHRLARLRMRHDGFVPSFAHTITATPALVPWPQLAAAIAGRVTAIMADLPLTVPYLKAIFLDCGDTLVDERSEVKTDGEVVVRGELIPGAREAVEALKAQGYRLVLVADGPRQSFVNLLHQHGLWDHFDAHVISQDVGLLKPHAAMFDAALSAIGLGRADVRHVVMVGNNLERDIRGANALGIASVLMDWSTLRARHATHPGDQPDYRIPSPRALPALIDSIELSLRYREPAFFLPPTVTD